MPYHDDSSPAKLQIFLSNYFGNSFFSNLLKRDNINFTVLSEDVPSHIPFKLDTSYMNIFFPGLWDHYGPDLKMDVENRLTNIRGFSSTSKEEYLAFHADAALNLYVNKADGTKEKAITIEVNDFFLNFTLLVKDMHTYAHINDIHLLSISSATSVFKPRLPLDLVTKFFNHVNDIAKALFNFISRMWKMKVPDNLFGLFKLSDLKFVYYDNYFEAAMTPTFLKPTLPDYQA